MNELVFPIAAAATVFFVVIPALTLVARHCVMKRRHRAASWAMFGSETSFAWLIAPTIVPLVWFISSVLHQNEPSHSDKSCLVDHAAPTTCTDALLLFGLLTVGMLISVGFRLWRETPKTGFKLLPVDHSVSRRIAIVVESDHRLRALRILAVQKSVEPIYTRGLFQPKVIVDACFVRDSDDEVLRAALLHEYAHVQGRDTLRNFIARVCLFLNPVGFLLEDEFRRWREAREANCDGMAVHFGGQPLALAEGIVRAAKFRCCGLEDGVVALGGGSLSFIRLRVELLMNGPDRPMKTFGHNVLLAFVLLAIVVPHVSGFELLNYFHFEVERLVRF